MLLAPDHVDPATLHGRWLLESIRVAALVVALTAAARLLLTFIRPVPMTERRLVDHLVDEWGDTALAPFQVGDDKSFFITRDRGCFVGYVLVQGVAVALGDPVGPPQHRVQATIEFRAWCELNGWIPAAHQLTTTGAADARLAQFNVVKIGEEAIVELGDWKLEAAGHKSLRSALRRVERAGFDVVELPTPIDDDAMGQLRAVSDEWLADGHRERTFTLGQFDEDRLRDAVVFAVRHRDTGRITAFVDVIDTYRSSVGNFDLMRRRPDSPNGVMDALIVALIERFAGEGRTGMTLGLAPMVNIDGNRVSERTMRLIYERGETWFNYQGLRHFKDKWDPRWQPRYLAYPSDATLPKVALAVARAGELPDPAAWSNRLRRIGRRMPATICLTSIIVWFMAATTGSATAHRDLLRHIGLAWRDLAHAQLWRLPTSQLAETRPGFVWSNIALLLVVLPIAEWRLGTRRTVIVFFVGDWVSTLITLAGLRLAAPWSPSAAHILTVRDAGPSAGAWALATTIALTLRPPRLRRTVTAAVFAFLVAALVLHGRLFDVQHLLSAGAAAAGVRLWDTARNRRAAPGRPAGPPAPAPVPMPERPTPVPADLVSENSDRTLRPGRARGRGAADGAVVGSTTAVRLGHAPTGRASTGATGQRRAAPHRRARDR